MSAITLPETVAIIEAGAAPGEARVTVLIDGRRPTLAHAAEVLKKHGRFIDEALALVRSGQARRVAVTDGDDAEAGA